MLLTYVGDVILIHGSRTNISDVKDTGDVLFSMKDEAWVGECF